MKTYELTQLNQFTEDDTTAVVVTFVLSTMFVSCMRSRQEPDCTLRDRIHAANRHTPNSALGYHKDQKLCFCV